MSKIVEAWVKLTMIISRSENVYRSMAALTSLICISSTSTFEITLFFVVASEVEPFISHAEALVDALDDSNPEKPCFRAFVGLARAFSLHYLREGDSRCIRITHDMRKRLIRLLHAYRYVVHCSGPQTSTRLRLCL